MKPDPRQIALEIIISATPQHTTLDKVLEKFQEQIEVLSPQDKKLCHALIFGVFRNLKYLDHQIESLSNIPLAKLEKKVIHLLRLALCQMIFMDRIPNFAAINTIIELAKKYHLKKASGFINAILRQWARNKSDIHPKNEWIAEKDCFLSIAINYSFPTWLVKKWVAIYGVTSTKDLCNTINQIPPLTLRINSLKTSRPEFCQLLGEKKLLIKSTSISPDGISLLHAKIPITSIPGYNLGLFQVQDESSQLVSRIMSPKKGERILDVCAGFGTKTFHMAQLMQNSGHITALDIDRDKLKRLEKEAERLDIKIVQTKNIDILKTSIKDFHTYFDRVLVDAPCSGLGVIRRNPDIKWKRSPQTIIKNSSYQKKILAVAANMIKPGGTLVYSVCSCEPEENQEVITSFLQNRKDYSLDHTIKNFDKLLTELPGCFKTYPDNIHLKMDGFFVARLIRNDV